MNASDHVVLHHDFATHLPQLARKAGPAPAPAPDLVVLNEPLARELGLDVDWLRTDSGVAFLLGLDLPKSAMPVAQLYSGHQFGGYSPQLGDGRALLLGEIATPEGLRDLHLKGSGPTPFTRGGDGLAALGPMLREYVVSESMHALGIPTTRSLAVVATGGTVLREDGALPGAVLVRVAASHLRVGTFQYLRASDQLPVLKTAVRYALERHHPAGLSAENLPRALFEYVVGAQAALVAQWLTVGFVHGVMNTDNVTISGETIDYGPCAFLDSYDPGVVFSSIDTGGRYAYGNQPNIAQWNLTRFAEALLPVIAQDESEAVEAGSKVLAQFPARFNEAWLAAMSAKLGVSADAPDTLTLVTTLHGLLEASKTDFTTFFRDLADAARGDRSGVHATSHDIAALDAWLEQWLARSPDAAAMDAVNPLHVPRNHLVEEALVAATAGDLTSFEALLSAVRDPFTPIEGGVRFTQPAPAEFSEGFRTFCGT